MSEEIAKKKKRGSGLLFLIVVVVVAALALVSGILKAKGVISLPSFSAPASRTKKERANPVNINFGNFKWGRFSSGGTYIARLYVTGVIEEANETYNHEWLLSAIERLENDGDNAGILLVVDSPGGTVYEADELYLALKKYKNSGKQVWAYFKGMAASGGYYAACAADSIYANRNTMTGSIGVIMGPTIDATALLDKIGIKATSFFSGRNKGMLGYNNSLTEEQRKIMQDLVDESYEQFVGIVAAARKKPLDEVKALADGRIYTARQAKENGLIDAVGTLENAEDRMRERVGIALGLSEEEADAIDFYDYEYIYEPPLMRRFFDAVAGDSLRKAVGAALGPVIKYPAYLYRQ